MDQQTIWFGRSSPQRTWKEPWELFTRAHATFPANPDRTKTYLHFSDNNPPAPNETHKGMICFCMLWIIIQNPDHQFCRVFSLMLSLLSKRRIVYTLYIKTHLMSVCLSQNEFAFWITTKIHTFLEAVKQRLSIVDWSIHTLKVL